MGRKIFDGVAVVLIAGLLTSLALGDPPPLAGVARVNTGREETIQDEVQNIWFQEYCPADRNHSRLAEEAASRHINDLQRQFQSLTGGVSIPLLPCP